jgi:hypothetical protein
MRYCYSSARTASARWKPYEHGQEVLLVDGFFKHQLLHPVRAPDQRLGTAGTIDVVVDVVPDVVVNGAGLGVRRSRRAPRPLAVAHHARRRPRRRLDRPRRRPGQGHARPRPAPPPRRPAPLPASRRLVVPGLRAVRGGGPPGQTFRRPQRRTPRRTVQELSGSLPSWCCPGGGSVFAASDGYHVDGLRNVLLASVSVSGNRLAEIAPCRIGL